MARELFATEPVFAETVTRCASAAADILERPMLDVIFDPEGPVIRHLASHVVCSARLVRGGVGLARLWQSWGIEPDVVLGHSVGQYSAACVAGVFSVEDGARLMAERGRLFGSLPAGGRMVAVFAAADRVESRTDEFPRLSVAAYNGANTVLSGPVEDLERAVAELTAEDVRCEWLDTSHAFHSVCSIRSSTNSRLTGRFEFGSPQRTLVCNRTGAAVGRQREAGRPLLAPPCAATRRFRQECTHAFRARLRGVAGGRPATGAHRRRPAGVARNRDRTGGHRILAPQWRRPSSDQRGARIGLRRRPSPRLRRIPAGHRPQGRPAHLPVPASRVLV